MLGVLGLVGSLQKTAAAETRERSFAFAKALPSPDSDQEFLPDCNTFCYVHWYGTGMVGRGLRLNNPFRLRTELGSSAESLSLTAPYTEFALGALFGDPFGFQQGATLALSVAVVGVPQQVLAPGYGVLLYLGPRWQWRSGAALPIVLQPDLNLGLDLRSGAAFFLFSGVGLTGDLVLSLYQGAATDQERATLVPLVSL